MKAKGSSSYNGEIKCCKAVNTWDMYAKRLAKRHIQLLHFYGVPERGMGLNDLNVPSNLNHCVIL